MYKREESHMKRPEMKKHFTSMKAAALTMLLSASLMASAAVPASAAMTAALTAPTGLETVQRDDDELTLAWNPVAGAQGYNVYLYDTDTNGWLQVERTSGTQASTNSRSMPTQTGRTVLSRQSSVQPQHQRMWIICA